MATGEFLDDYFEDEDYKFDKVIIESSPFWRCILSCQELLLGLGKEDLMTTVNYRASQVLVPETRKAEREYDQPEYCEWRDEQKRKRDARTDDKERPDSEDWLTYFNYSKMGKHEGDRIPTFPLREKVGKTLGDRMPIHP